MACMAGRRHRFSLTNLLRRRKSSALALRCAAIEALESRVLLSTYYSLNGNQLTTTTNGTPVVTTVGNSVTLTGDSTLNHFTIQNFSGAVTVNGGGGGDVISVFAG